MTRAKRPRPPEHLQIIDLRNPGELAVGAIGGREVNFWETITGSDLTRDCKAFEARVQALPADYQEAWGAINVHLSPFGGFTGRSLMPILNDALGLQGARSYRDRWRAQLNRDIARKLDRLGV